MLKIIALTIFCLIANIASAEEDYLLNIYINYLQQNASWRVVYELPIAVDHVAFERPSNFDRRKLYRLDGSKFKWDKEGGVLLVRSVDGSKFTSFELSFTSFYNHIQKDYTHNVKYTDGSVLLYTNHLTLGANIIEDKSISSIGKSFSRTRFHFFSPKQKIMFMGKTYDGKAQWIPNREGTYVYFGNITPILTDDLIAIVDPNLPKWAWQNAQNLFPQLFEYYKQKTGQALDFRPIVFFNYDNIEDDHANYSGGTLDGLVQISLKGKRWQKKNETEFNKLFHFLAHEAAHFWNGQMFQFEDQNHSWLHEGGADAFANFAMLDFGLINSRQMLQRFEEAVNSCVLNKGEESLDQSIRLQRFGNFYACGATMALASHYAIKGKNPDKSLFDLWKNIFNQNQVDKIYNQEDYFEQLNKLMGSKNLANALAEFSSIPIENNHLAVSSWFERTELKIHSSNKYTQSVSDHWGKQVISELMKMHCDGFSLSRYNDHAITHPMKNCAAFARKIELKYFESLDLFQDGIEAYKAFGRKCRNKDRVTLQDTNKAEVINLQCIKNVPAILPYLSLNPIN